MRIAMYKGPDKDSKFLYKFAHWAICLLTSSHYSHVELVIGDVCWSSSYRDGGVRCKRIDLTSGHWDLYEIDGDRAAALNWFLAHQGEKYDWLGMLRVCPALRWLPEGKGKFCSEAVGSALGDEDPETLSPQAVLVRHRRSIP